MVSHSLAVAPEKTRRTRRKRDSITRCMYQGNLRDGWVSCGGWFLGLFSDHVEARWDD
jgi:hypothetical protein